MGLLGLPHGDGGDAAGEGGAAERPQPLGIGADPEPDGPLAAAHHRRGLCHAAALRHQRCESCRTDTRLICDSKTSRFPSHLLLSVQLLIRAGAQ